MVIKQDNAMWNALQNRTSYGRKNLVAIVDDSTASSFTGAIGQSTIFASPTTPISKIDKVVEIEDPAIVYYHTSFDTDSSSTEEHSNIMEYVEHLRDQGRTCVVADTQGTARWKNLTPTPCRGDLSFYCNHSTILDELVKWAARRDNGYPRCTADLLELEFADLIAG